MPKLKRANRGRKWSKDDIEYLKENYGMVDTKYIAKKLGRTVIGVKKKAWTIFRGLKKCEVQCLYSVADLQDAFGVNMGIIHQRWIGDKKMPAIKHKAKVNYTYSIELDKFWEWLKENKNKVTISMNKVNLDVLEYYPDWFIDDYNNKKNYHSSRKSWSKKEEELLNKLYYHDNKTASEIAIELDRTTESVYKKIAREAKQSLTKTA